VLLQPDSYDIWHVGSHMCLKFSLIHIYSLIFLTTDKNFET